MEVANTRSTLLDRLNEIVDDVHIDEVKEIINTLSKISNLKHSIGSDLSSDDLYAKISNELKIEFNIINFKIIQIEAQQEILLYQKGEDIQKYGYVFTNVVINNIKINIFIDDTELSKYQVLCLNTYFKELVHLLYIQMVLLDLQKSSTVDPLTKLQNRTAFNIEMKTLVPLAIREQMKFGVILLNIDRFRAVNDEHGDEFGDEFLKLYAKTIKSNIRTSDIAVRFSGGEFLVLLTNVDSEERTVMIAEKLKEILAQTYLISPNNDHFKKTVSVGISMFPEDSSDINEVIKFSDSALCDARDNGRNSLVRYKNSHGGSFEFF